MNEIPTQAEMQELVERNKNAPYTPPVYTAWTANKGLAFTETQLRECNRQANVTPQPLDYGSHVAWQKRLHSKHWRVQTRGQNRSRLIERPVRGHNSWTMVPMNGGKP